jgi:Outer membrane receptor for monomeric catechols
MQSAFRLNALSSALKNLHTRQIDATSLPGNKIQAAALACALLMPGMALAETPSTPKETTLSTVKVEESSENTAQDTGYQATRTRVGKVLQDPQDIPQAVTTITHQLMEDQQVGSLREALRNVSGLTFNASEGGRSGDNMMLRGFYTFGDIYLDGIRDTAQYNRETFSLEQIDVLRGCCRHAVWPRSSRRRD